ncbi:hypothetical protein PSAC2689_220061 [Paraburkholderia sacchari]|uniref:hypothetical protein n=1 Tax=Paraburkholderia sacchari TaxID=159450 RepID=UPI0039A4742A
MDAILEKRYAEILAAIAPSFLDPNVARGRKISTPFLVSGPKNPDARRIMVIGREYGGNGWIVPHECDGPNAYVTKALSRHRNFFDGAMAKNGRDRGDTFFNFMRDLGRSVATEGLIYSNLLCCYSSGWKTRERDNSGGNNSLAGAAEPQVHAALCRYSPNSKNW